MAEVDNPILAAEEEDENQDEPREEQSPEAEEAEGTGGDASAEPVVEVQEVEALITEGKGELDDLGTENKVLERRLLVLQKRRSTIGTKLFLEGADSLLQTELSEWAKAKDELDRLILEYDEKIDKIQEQIEEKKAEAKAFREEFLAYRWQMSSQAEHSITGKPINVKVLQKMQNEETQLDQDIESLRVEEKQLRTQVKKLEHAIWLKEQLPGGLHLVDFEQLKIENESLTEKLSKKNDDIAALRKKTTHVVNVLTHYQEKLQQVQKETEIRSKSLEAVDHELLMKRKELHHTKAKCKSLRSKLSKIQDNVVKVGNPALVDDLEMHKENVEAYEKQIQDLKGQYFAHVQRIKVLRRSQTPLIADSSVLGLSRIDNETSRSRWGIKRQALGKRCISALQ